jgi:hypothetical protein
VISGEHAKREMVTGNKLEASERKNDEHTPSKEADNKHKESASSIKSHRKGDKKKKKMKKVVYYETDSSSPSTYGAESTTSKHQEHKKYSKMPLRYHRIPKRAPDKKKKKMKKVVYYETDSSSPSTYGAESTTSKHQEHKKYSKMPLRYHRIPKRAPLLSVPLGKPPYFDGEYYCMWSDKMRHHLISLTKAYGILLSLERRHHRWATRTTTPIRPSK